MTFSSSTSANGGGSMDELEETAVKEFFEIVGPSLSYFGGLISNVKIPEIMDPVDSLGLPYNTTGGDSSVMFKENFGAVMLEWLSILEVGLMCECELVMLGGL